MLGVCCQWLEQRGSRLVNVLNERSLQLGRFLAGEYSPSRISSTYSNNVRELHAVVGKMSSAGIGMFRISSSLFPLWDKVDRSLWDNSDVRSALASLGSRFMSLGMRVTTHPGQFCVLSSDRPDVAASSASELEFHGWVFDAMGFDRSPKWAINVHGGKADRIDVLAQRILALPDSVRCRLTLENDELSYSVADLLSVYRLTGVPVVLDTHHHTFNTGELTLEEAHDAACATWPAGTVPLQHISNTDPALVSGSFSDRRKHSQLIHIIQPVQLEAMRSGSVDVDVEAKLKNIAVLKAMKDFCIPL